MSWVTVIWSVVASACLTLAAIHLTIWFKKRTAWTDLAFSAMAVATAAMAAGELRLMHSETAEEYAVVVRWLHVPYWAVVISLVVFTRLYLRAGRAWLGWAAAALRTSALLLNFLVGPNINYRQITGLRRIPFLGGSFPFAEGVVNPWLLLGHLSLVLLVVFIADAAATAWRRGDRRQALVVGGSTAFFVFAAVSLSVLVLWLGLHLPIMHSFFCLGVVVAMYSDITHQALLAERLADKLRESEARYRAIFEESIAGIFRTTLDGKVLFVNPAMARLLGYGSAEETLRTITDVGRQVWVDPEERLRFLRRLQEAGTVEAYECRFRRKEGTPIWVSVAARAVRGPDGGILWLDGFAENIDELKRAELALAEGEMRYRTLFEMTPGGIIAVDYYGYVLAANSAQARLYGYESPQQLIGFYSPLFIAERDRERAIQEMTELLRGNRHGERTYTAVRRDGSEFSVEVTFAILRGPDEEVQGYLCLSRDLTKSQQDEIERNQLRQERTHLARVLTVDEISTSLAHEINQPLGAILNNAEAARILLSKAEDKREVFSEIVEDIIQDAQRAGDIVRKVRKVLKKSDVRFERLPINGLIEESLEVLRNNLALNNVTLRLELAPDPADIWGDRIRLQQVLLNLITNALDAMKKTPSKILTVRSATADPDTVVVSISDTGPGIVEADRRMLFQPYFTTKKEGLGLGLPICRSIIEEHGGRIWADKNPGGGATFAFSLRTRPQ